MLDVALEFLREQLQSYITARTGADAVEVKLSRVVDEGGKYAFPEESLALSLVNVEEERTFREQLPSHAYVDGQHVVREPELRLNLQVLVAANFKVYAEALKYVALALTFFQANGVFSGDRFPSLDPAIGKLTVELQSLGFEQLNQLWAFVGGRQLPSVVYRVRLVALRDVAPATIRPPILTIDMPVSAR